MPRRGLYPLTPIGWDARLRPVPGTDVIDEGIEELAALHQMSEGVRAIIEAGGLAPGLVDAIEGLSIPSHRNRGNPNHGAPDPFGGGSYDIGLGRWGLVSHTQTPQQGAAQAENRRQAGAQEERNYSTSPQEPGPGVGPWRDTEQTRARTDSTTQRRREGRDAGVDAGRDAGTGTATGGGGGDGGGTDAGPTPEETHQRLMGLGPGWIYYDENLDGLADYALPSGLDFGLDYEYTIPWRPPTEDVDPTTGPVSVGRRWLAAIGRADLAVWGSPRTNPARIRPPPPGSESAAPPRGSQAPNLKRGWADEPRLGGGSARAIQRPRWEEPGWRRPR